MKIFSEKQVNNSRQISSSPLDLTIHHLDIQACFAKIKSYFGFAKKKAIYKKGYPDEVGLKMRTAYENGRIKNAAEFEEVLNSVLYSCEG